MGVLDADIYGPSIPTLFNAHEPPEMKMVGEKQIMIPVIKQGIKLLSIGMITSPEQAIVWRGPMISSAFKQFINDVEWGDLDYLIIDLPPGTGDVQLTLAQLVPLTGAGGTTPQEVAMADARRAISMFKMPAIKKHILGVVENMAWFEPEDAPGKRYHIFGKGGEESWQPNKKCLFWGELPLVSLIQQQSDVGTINPDSERFLPFMQFAEEVARHISMLNSEKMAKFAEQ